MDIADFLLPERVNLQLTAKNKVQAVEELLSLLRGHPRVPDWEKLRKAVFERDAAPIATDNRAICIAHGRCNPLGGLVIAAGRVHPGIICPELSIPVPLFFVVGIPPALTNDYLRIMGALARMAHNASRYEGVLAAQTKQEFIDLLRENERNA